MTTPSTFGEFFRQSRKRTRPQPVRVLPSQRLRSGEHQPSRARACAPPLAQETLDLYATDRSNSTRNRITRIHSWNWPRQRGQIPADVFEKQNASQQLPRVDRRIRGEHDRIQTG